ncbi:protein mono-ADP-ribosyltransferase PARP16 [Venturia canescens]|uniref:protein mono-ADP-ribosyltransferase PARP16 n=1 Tax=Venturia canescens TaxID=32260 RepID=UPI001C9CE719|nr:protein mono-ADP-ribosyltransferase PARP16 [Venturia canescens]XP_043280336.1 protein mono-ADP-ribosyltransferase PARP16 [Venturia canescens]
MQCVTKRGQVCDEGWDEEANDIANNQADFYRHTEIARIPRTMGSMDFLSSDESSERKVHDLRSVLERDPAAADLKWSLFVAACNTYRHNTCLMPFPPMYTEREGKDIEALREAIEVIPPLAIVFQQLNEINVYDRYGKTIDLLHWVLVQSRDPYITSVCRKSYESVLRKVPSEMAIQGPNLIFQIASAKHSIREEKWRAASQGFSTFYAYHGSRLENFYSIIHYGIQKSMCKTGLFGNGIYLSSELGVSLPYSPVGYGWGGSILGSELSCVALCEVINHPDVKRGDAGDDGRNIAEDSEGGKIPNKYYLVQNSDLVRIRYLLVYSQGFSRSKNAKNQGLVGWFKRNKMLTFVLGYVVLLASVGLSQNKNIEKFCRLLSQKIGL